MPDKAQTNPKKISHFQTVMHNVDMDKLKEITGESHAKNALAFAAEHTIKTYVKPELKPGGSSRRGR